MAMSGEAVAFLMLGIGLGITLSLLALASYGLLEGRRLRRLRPLPDLRFVAPNPAEAAIAALRRTRRPSDSDYRITDADGGDTGPSDHPEPPAEPEAVALPPALVNPPTLPPVPVFVDAPVPPAAIVPFPLPAVRPALPAVDPAPIQDHAAIVANRPVEHRSPPPPPVPARPTEPPAPVVGGVVFRPVPKRPGTPPASAGTPAKPGDAS
ncbi:hypothetical protein [Devosia sp.]|uniref:hypothetical protein n=1 Tax=Devosia sp. TaxID=1871048 RepID=UPI0035B12C15